MERVVVTGLGVVSCVGCDVASFWAALTAGRSGIEPISAYDPAPYEVRIAGEAKDFAFDAKLGKRMDRFTQFALTAAKQALEQAGLMPEEGESQGVNPERIGVSIGSGIGGFPFLMAQHQKFLETGRFHPLTVPIIISNMAAANLAMQYKLQGPNLCITTACASARLKRWLTRNNTDVLCQYLDTHEFTNTSVLVRNRQLSAGKL